MSLSYVPLETVQILAPRVKFDEKRTYGILAGPEQVTAKPTVSTSYSTTSIQFSAPPPSPAIAIDRKVYLKMFYQLTFAGSGTGNLLQIGVNDGLRQFPNSSIINTIAVTINNAQVSINMSDVIHAMMRYGDQMGYKDEYSEACGLPDQYQDYNDWTTYGSARNPLAQYGENSYQDTRSNSEITVVSNSNTAAVVNVVVTEPIFLSPFFFGHGETSSFIGVQTMDWNITVGDLSRLWAHSSAGNTISSISVSFSQAPQLLFQYLTPNPIHTPYMPNKSYVYPYFVVDRYTTSYGNITAGSSASITSSNIQLQSIPKRLLIYARRRNEDRTYNTTDTFARVDSISINWNNNSGLLSSASKNDLYHISRKNGLNMSYNQWNDHCGSPLAIDLGDDIGLSPLEAPGTLGTYQLNMTVNVTNTSSNTVNYTLYVVTISEGSFTITQNRSIPQIAVISKDDVLNSRKAPFISYNQDKGVYGAGFFSDLWSGIKKVGSTAADIGSKLGIKPSDVVGLIPGQVGSLGSQGLRSLGYGRRAVGRGLSNRYDSYYDEDEDLHQQKLDRYRQIYGRGLDTETYDRQQNRRQEAPQRRGRLNLSLREKILANISDD